MQIHLATSSFFLGHRMGNRLGRGGGERGEHPRPRPPLQGLWLVKHQHAVPRTEHKFPENSPDFMFSYRTVLQTVIAYSKTSVRFVILKNRSIWYLKCQILYFKIWYLRGLFFFFPKLNTTNTKKTVNTTEKQRNYKTSKEFVFGNIGDIRSRKKS